MTHRTIELGDGWQIRADPHERGRKDGWQERSGAEDAPGTWVPAAVPGTMQGILGMGAPPVCWYRRVLDGGTLSRAAGQRVWLQFESVATDATVWVNGKLAGRHVGDWVPFQFDITEWIAPGGGETVVVVRVDRMLPGKETWIDGAPVQGGHLTKGFHDILSVHKGGIWQPVRLEITGDLVLVPDGLGVTPDSRSGEVRVDCEFARSVGGGRVEIEVRSPSGEVVARGAAEVKDGADSVSLHLRVESPALWSPESSRLYAIAARLIGADGWVSQSTSTRFGFRRVEHGGKDGRQILLNGRPVFLSGILDWGHEPRHISPTPTPEELRTRFAALRERGFNLVCVCMWYAPRYFYEIADEMGMMVWQEHPVWKSPMGDEHIAEYQRQFIKFFRRDRNHASVVLVSGSCEHERFNPTLAAWWWGRVRAIMPDRLAQIQTAFFAWTDLTKTDAYDEHTYDSCGRWVRYLADLQEDLGRLPPRPFIMGESILYTNWPDVDGLRGGGAAAARPWWTPVGLDAAARLESEIVERFGRPVLDRFKRQARRFHLEGRKFQFEAYRAYENHAGLVMNHLRDVPACRCGFQDEDDKWYFSPEELKPWLGETALLLRTPEQLRGVSASPGGVAIEVGVSNFSARTLEGAPKLTVDEGRVADARASASAVKPGEVWWSAARLDLPRVDSPRRVELRASLPGGTVNAWTLWNLPVHAAPPRGVVRLAGLPFDEHERALEFEDKGYSSGWGSPVRTWTPLMPDPAVIVPELAAWSGVGAPAAGTRCVLTHRLTQALVDFMNGGGRVVLLASRARGSAPVKFVNMWGQLPLIIERGPLGAGDAEWVADLLDHDLSRRSVRAVPVGELGLEETLEPVIRLVYCHDIVDRPRVLDFVSTAAVGERGGVLVISAADHTMPAGRYLLDRLLAYAAGEKAESGGRLTEAVLKSWAVPA